MGGKTGGTESWSDAQIFTVGHSTRTLDELVALLRAFDVSILVDIRTIPKSRHNPQFNADALPSALHSRHLRYVHIPELGGLRRMHKSSPNAAWRNASFRGFADYMLTEDFEIGISKLRALVSEGSVALMCAEAVPWRCHRSLVADVLTVRGASVGHIASAKRATPHHVTPFAKVEGTRITYPEDKSVGEPLATRAPFHLEATVRVLQRRPKNRVDVWEQDRYLRVLTTVDGLALIEVANRGTIDQPDVRFSVLQGNPSAGTRAGLGQTAQTILGLSVNPEPLQRLTAVERGLGPTVRALRGMRPPRFPNLFEAFARVVPFQQLSLDAGVAAVTRLVESFSESIEHDGRRYHAFPTARAIAEARPDALKESGLSLRKVETIRRVASAIESGQLAEDKLIQMTSKDAIQHLTEIRGIGPWTAALVLLRGLGRLDVFPPGDVGAMRGLGKLMHLEPRAPIDRVVERFGEDRGYLYFCSLGADLLAKGLIHPASRMRRSSRSASK